MPDLPLTSTAAGFASNQGVSPTDSGINSPQLSPTGSGNKPKQRAVTDVNHLFRIIDGLLFSRRSQNEKNGRIMSKLNSERPYEDSALKSEGLGYKSNFSTKPLSTTVGKVSSRLTKAVQAARYLTSSELPDSVPDAKTKTELFRKEITNCVRKWPGWYNFLNEVAFEDAVFGWTSVAWLDTVSWKPVHFRQDRAYVPDGTKQTVDAFQFAAFQLYLMPHELADLIRDRSAAEAAGWDIDNTVESINNARPPTIPTAQAAPYTDFRRYEDALRESSVSFSLMSGAKQVLLWHVYVTEIDGKVSHYIADGNSKKLLFTSLDQFDGVRDAIAFMSYEHAATLMGSKGIGREVYEIAGALDRARNEVVDRLQLSGKILVQGDENQISRFKLTVLGNVAIIPKGFEIAQNKIESQVEDFLKLDQLLTALLDQIAGGVTPRNFERERVTAQEVQLWAAREEEKRDDITTRFVTQFGEIVSTIQRRICDSRTTDDDAKAAREKLLLHMTDDELRELADQPALRTIEDYTQSEAQRVVLFAQEKRNDPLYNHRELEKRAASALINPEFAEAVLLPENDPNEAAEQVRQQLLENELLAKGEEVPVSQRDNYQLHVAALKQALAPVAQAAGGGDASALGNIEAFLKHWQAHLESALSTGASKQDFSADLQELKSVAQHVGELQAQAQAQAQAQMQAQQAAAVGVPQAAPGAAPLAAAPSPELAPAPVAPAA